MRKRKDITLYDGGFLVAIVIVALVFFVGVIKNVVKKNLERDPHFYDINWEQPTNINWGQFFTQTQSTQSYIPSDYSRQQEEYIWKQQEQEENEPSYFEKWQQEQEQKQQKREQEEAYKKAHTKVQKYNIFTNEYEYIYPDQVQKYNIFTNEYEWTYPDEQLHYNWDTGEYEY